MHTTQFMYLYYWRTHERNICFIVMTNLVRFPVILPSKTSLNNTSCWRTCPSHLRFRFFTVTGKRTRGRNRLQLMSNICEGYETAKKRAEDRCLWCVSVMGVIDLLLQQNTRRRRLILRIYFICSPFKDWESQHWMFCPNYPLLCY